MEFTATHRFLGDLYMAYGICEDNSDFFWAAKPLHPNSGEEIWLYSEESWEACDSAEYGITHSSEWLCYTDGTLTNHTVDEIEVLTDERSHNLPPVPIKQH